MQVVSRWCAGCEQLVDDSRCTHPVESADTIASINAIVALLSPRLSPAVLDDPVGFATL